MDTKNNPVDVDFMFKERNFLCFIMVKGWNRVINKLFAKMFRLRAKLPFLQNQVLNL